MDTQFAIDKAKGRENLAKLLGVAPITTYQWKDGLPAHHVRFLKAARPRWFKEYESRQAADSTVSKAA